MSRTTKQNISHTKTERRQRRTSSSARRLALATIIIAPALTGCSGSGGFASMNPFNKGTATAPSLTPEGTPALVASAKSNEQPGRLASFTNATKATLAKTTGAVTGMFKKDEQEPIQVENDPLSLASTPEELNPKIHVANGQLWESTGKPDKAMESYQRALEIDPNHVKALASIARLNYQNGEYSVAAETFQKALAQSPNDAKLYNELGLTLHKLGRTDMAITVMQRALTLSPMNSRFANNLASVMHESGNIGGAYEVLAKNNKPAVAHFNMAYLQFKSGNTDDARRHLNEAVKFESSADGDAAVARAVSRGKEMLAQLDASVPAGNIAAAPAAKLAGAPETRTASLPAAVATATPPAGTPTTGTPTTGYGWPANGVGSTAATIAPASSTDNSTDSVKQAGEMSGMSDDDGAAKIPAWLKEVTEAKKKEMMQEQSAKAPTRIAKPSSGFQLPQ